MSAKEVKPKLSSGIKREYCASFGGKHEGNDRGKAS
jgi:hypothetical protein